MKQLLFDLMATQPNNEMKYHGGAEYTKAVFYVLSGEFNKTDYEIYAFYDFEKMLDPMVDNTVKDNNFTVFNCSNIADVEVLLRNGKFDIFFSGLPYDYCDIDIPIETKFVFTIHGLRQIENMTDKYMWLYEKNTLRNIAKRILMKIYPQRWEAIYYERMKRILYKFDNKLVLTVSEHSKASILVNFPRINPEEVMVCYSPKKFSFANEEKEEEFLTKYGIQKDRYFLLISCDRWQKNNYRAVIALDQLFSTHSEMLSEYKVVALGTPKDNFYIKHIKNKNKFIFEGYVESEELESFYKYAHLFIYPTLNEGFGYPPMEAMKYGTVSACSAVTSVPEACGDVVLYFNPFDPMEIKNRVLQSLNEKIINEKKASIPSQFEKITKLQKESLNSIVEYILT
jgi:hypothetical protein